MRKSLQYEVLTVLIIMFCVLAAVVMEVWHYTGDQHMFDWLVIDLLAIIIVRDIRKEWRTADSIKEMAANLTARAKDNG